MHFIHQINNINTMGGTRNEDSKLEHKIISLFFENDNLLPKLQNIWL